ncbi:NAD-dependent epimerase/dehydratase family protein [Kitasatospora xanthocidica]|uniref:NAD-dependent epimerase/dehydratase family protein n=1 Tax=Kitasatospora xanthocidica TaxID=83382 RepID=A0A372ZK80_9ACTN|nr:NAD(P)H-binding protein [Kitasatospora xanthocidica]RGD55657.1 NAD-dependent epimerase/dehydratase family protein [Kitasatospora xanthocidica]
MRITVFGATGNVGRRVVAEALSRGHHVTAVVRDPAKPHDLPSAVTLVVGDARTPEDVARIAAGQDVVVTATRPVPGSEHELAIATKGLLAGIAGTGVRLLAVGGAGSLLVPGGGGTTLVDSPGFPDAIRPIALACGEQLDLYRAAGPDTDWTYLSPAALLEPGVRTGRFRTGRDELLVDADGTSAISMEDLAVALLDETERPAHRRSRFTAAY